MELESSFKVDTDLIMTPQQLRDTYMWGVQVKNAEGVELGDDVYKFYLEAAQQEIEDYFNIKLKRQVIQETPENFQPSAKLFPYFNLVKQDTIYKLDIFEIPRPKFIEEFKAKEKLNINDKVEITNTLTN